MYSGRRTTPIPQDFALALARAGIEPKSLLPLLDIPSMPEITQPALPPIPKAEEPPPNLAPLLGPELSSSKETELRRYIPKHLPELPSRHTWQATAVFPERETDAKTIRERAMQEGVEAEQALRKLTAATRAEKEKSKEMRHEQSSSPAFKANESWKMALEAAQSADRDEEAREDQDGEADDLFDDTQETRVNGVSKMKSTDDASYGSTAAAAVNYENQYWISGARSRA
jgi:transcription initiation factor TFIID subunit 8